MSQNLIRPQAGVSYTLQCILQDLELKDSPHLGFIGHTADGFEHRTVIQDSHVTQDEFLASGIGDTFWVYRYTTQEWIPVFEAVDSAEVCKFVDITRDGSEFAEPHHLWVTPKGCPRPWYNEPDADYAARVAKDKATWTPAQCELQLRVEKREAEDRASYLAEQARRAARSGGTYESL